MKRTFTLALIACVCACFANCDSGGGEEKPTPQISISDGGQLTQTAYADEETTGAGFTFTALESWTATAEETRATVPSWITFLFNGIATASGEAGTYDLKIRLEPNYTGKERKALLTLKTLSGYELSVPISQSGKTKSGEIPEEPGEYGNGTGWIRFEDSPKVDINYVGWQGKDVTHQLDPSGVSGVTVYMHTFKFQKLIGKDKPSDEASAEISVYSATAAMPTGTFTTGWGQGATDAEKSIGYFAMIEGGVKDEGGTEGVVTGANGQITITEKSGGNYQITYDFEDNSSEPKWRLSGEWLGSPEALN